MMIHDALGTSLYGQNISGIFASGGKNVKLVRWERYKDYLFGHEMEEVGHGRYNRIYVKSISIIAVFEAVTQY